MGLEARNVPSSIHTRPATTNTPDVGDTTPGHLPDSSPAARIEGAGVSVHHHNVPSATFTQRPAAAEPFAGPREVPAATTTPVADTPATRAEVATRPSSPDVRVVVDTRDYVVVNRGGTEYTYPKVIGPSGHEVVLPHPIAVTEARSDVISSPQESSTAVDREPPSVENTTKTEETPKKLGRNPAEITHNDLYARHAGASANEADLNNLEESAQERVTLPGISGIPVRLLHNHDTAEAALRATERVYDMYLHQLGIDDKTIATQLDDLANRSTDVMRNLFSGEKDTDPDGARVAGIQALKTAATLYETLVKGEVESVSIPKDNNSIHLTEFAENEPDSVIQQVRETSTATVPPEKMERAAAILDAAYSPDVATKLKDIYARYASLTDEEIAHQCNAIQKDIERAVGFDHEFGTFRLDRPGPDNLLFYPHVWSIDRRGRRLDFSRRQFKPYLNEENQTDPDSFLIDENHPDWNRYQAIHEDY